MRDDMKLTPELTREGRARLGLLQADRDHHRGGGEIRHQVPHPRAGQRSTTSATSPARWPPRRRPRRRAFRPDRRGTMGSGDLVGHRPADPHPPGAAGGGHADPSPRAPQRGRMGAVRRAGHGRAGVSRAGLPVRRHDRARTPGDRAAALVLPRRRPFRLCLRRRTAGRADRGAWRAADRGPHARGRARARPGARSGPAPAAAAARVTGRPGRGVRLHRPGAARALAPGQPAGSDAASGRGCQGQRARRAARARVGGELLADRGGRHRRRRPVAWGGPGRHRARRRGRRAAGLSGGGDGRFPVPAGDRRERARGRAGGARRGPGRHRSRGAAEAGPPAAGPAARRRRPARCISTATWWSCRRTASSACSAGRPAPPASARSRSSWTARPWAAPSWAARGPTWATTSR